MTTRPFQTRYVNVVNSIAGSSQENYTLFTATFPITVTNLALQFQCRDSTTDNFHKIYFVLHILRESLNSSLIGDGHLDDLYSPERDVVLAGLRLLHTGSDEITQIYDKRDDRIWKLKVGDLISLSVENDSTNTLESVRGIISWDQFS